jgi:putative MATE family efflux protein
MFVQSIDSEYLCWLFLNMAKENKDFLLSLLRDNHPMTGWQQFRLVVLLAVPAILAQLSSVILQYIDTAMVGHLGANPSASIGLISTSTWLCNGFFFAVISGFSVQVAHRCGAKDFANAKTIVRQGLFTIALFTIALALIAIAIAKPLPGWLGGTPEINTDASRYFMIYAAFMPIGAVGYCASSMLQASGNMKVPSIIYVSLGVLGRHIQLHIHLRMRYGRSSGAALGTGVAEVLASIFAVWYLTCRSKELAFKGERGSYMPTSKVLRNTLGITGPMWLQNIVMRGAFLASTIIIAPLGAISIAANSFAINAESFCYMPGYGLQDAASTLVGQSLGAHRQKLAKRFAWIAIGLASLLMSFLAIFMYIFAPQIMSILSIDDGIVSLGAKVLRIEAFAETLYAVSIVAYGACVGAGKTLVPTILNFCSMWLVRIGLALVLTPKYGLTGYWIAMCIELNVRGNIVPDSHEGRQVDEVEIGR